MFRYGGLVHNARFLIAANRIYSGRHLIAAAVIYAHDVAEPSFTYILGGRKHTAHLYRRSDRVPPALDAALNVYIRDTALSWASVTAHLECPPEKALALAVVRAIERWVCRQPALPGLAETCLLLPTKKLLTDLPAAFHQITRSKGWHVAAARALCRYHAAKG